MVCGDFGVVCGGLRRFALREDALEQSGTLLVDVDVLWGCVLAARSNCRW